MLPNYLRCQCHDDHTVCPLHEFDHHTVDLALDLEIAKTLAKKRAANFERMINRWVQKAEDRRAKEAANATK